MNEGISTKMNRQLGTKWFTFYTKVRPWIACLFSLTFLVDFVKYTDLYLGYWWLLLYFAAGIAQPVLAIIVFIKSSGDYEEFVRFVKGVLIFETINIAYQQGVEQYLTEFEIGSPIAISLVLLVAGYFLWYRLNIKYFERRIVKEVPDINCNLDSVPSPTQAPDSSEAPKTQDNINETISASQKAVFCRKCGNKLTEDSLFCSMCGTKIN